MKTDWPKLANTRINRNEITMNIKESVKSSARKLMQLKIIIATDNE